MKNKNNKFVIVKKEILLKEEKVGLILFDQEIDMNDLVLKSGYSFEEFPH